MRFSHLTPLPPPRCAALLFALVACSSKERPPAADTAAAATPAPAPAATPAPATPASAQRQRIREGYPTSLIDALNRETRAIAGTAAAQPDAAVQQGAQAVIALNRRWIPHQRVTVAFLGGSDALRKDIAEAAQEWAQVTGLALDFWTDPAHTRFREWTHSDATYQAHIRIAFEGGADGGYWSVIGRDATRAAVRRAGQTTLNLDGFDVQRPIDWRATTLHEFGHAVGLQHEHQSPIGVCEHEFRWEDEPGYIPTRDAFQQFVADAQGRQPGIYTTLGGPPNGWDRAKVDFNLRQLAFDMNVFVSAFDPQSIMKYFFDPWMFVSGEGSSCYSAPNDDLSPVNRQVAAQQYGNGGGAPPAAVVAQERAKLDSLGLTTTERAKLIEAGAAIRAKQAQTNTAIPQ